MADYILLEDPVVLPSSETITASVMWIDSINIHTPGPNQEGNVTISYYPMDTNGNVYRVDRNGNSLLKTIATGHLFRDIQNIPELAIAFNAIIAAVKPLEQYRG